MLNADTNFYILIVDDEPLIHSAIKRCLRNEPYKIITCDSGKHALSLIRDIEFNLFIIDLKMPEMSGLALLEKLKNKRPDIPVLILSGTASIQEAVEAVRSGAMDFIEKPFHPENFKNRISQIYKFWLLSRENERLHQIPDHTFDYRGFIGNSPSMLMLKEMISRVAPTDESVLIQGETGTGKELVARAIHSQSRRSEKPFRIVDCSGISESLIESELFGHEKGAFTGATSSYQGLIRSAEGGTLFLDEIGELPLNIQAKLLRVLQEKTVRPVGKSEDAPVDIRIVAATNKNLQKDIARGTFRKDLFTD